MQFALKLSGQCWNFFPTHSFESPRGCTLSNINVGVLSPSSLLLPLDSVTHTVDEFTITPHLPDETSPTRVAK